jgi:hypothetical protein
MLKLTFSLDKFSNAEDSFFPSDTYEPGKSEE